MGREVWGAAAPPPQLLGNSVFWAAAVLFGGSSNGGREGGVFQFSGGRTMSKGGVLVNVQERGCFSIFRRANDVTWTMSKGGGVLVNVFTPPPPLNKILGNQPLCPPPLTKAFPYAYDYMGQAKTPVQASP